MTTIVILVPGIGGSVLQDLTVSPPLTVWLNLALYDWTYDRIDIGRFEGISLADIVEEFVHPYRHRLKTKLKDLSSLKATRVLDDLVEPFGIRSTLVPSYLKTIKWYRQLGYTILEKQQEWKIPTNVTSGSKLFYEFPYDWRQTVEHNADKLAELINGKIKPTIQSPGIYLLSHSMGGLVSRAYLSKYGPENIKKHFMLGTPNHGAPKAYAILQTGKYFMYSNPLGGFLPPPAKDVYEMIPGIYDLLPSRYYGAKFTARNVYGPLVTCIGYNPPPDDVDATYIEGIGSNMNDIWYALNNNNEVRRALSFHENLGRKTFMPEGTTYAVYGADLETIVGMENVDFAPSPRTCTDGDGTVPARSAYDLEGIVDDTGKPIEGCAYRASGVGHTDLITDPDILSAVTLQIH